MKCIFCERSDLIHIEDHHLLPTAVQKAMGWRGKQAKAALRNYKVPLCGICHDKLTLLIAPLIKIIGYTRVSPIPVEFAFMLKNIHNKLMQNTEVNQT